MNTYLEIAASWLALDVLILVGWHAAHVLLRAPRTNRARTQRALSQPMPARATQPARATSMRTPVHVG